MASAGAFWAAWAGANPGPDGLGGGAGILEPVNVGMGGGCGGGAFALAPAVPAPAYSLVAGKKTQALLESHGKQAVPQVQTGKGDMLYAAQSMPAERNTLNKASEEASGAANLQLSWQSPGTFDHRSKS